MGDSSAAACASVLEHQCKMAHSLMLPERLAVLLRNQHSRMMKASSSSSAQQQNHPAARSFCDRWSAAAVDILILLVVLAACGVLFSPYFKYARDEALELLPVALVLVGELASDAPIAFALSLAVAVATVVILAWEAWEACRSHTSKCSNPSCRGLRRAMEFDIQIETEERVKASSSSASSSSSSSISSSSSRGSSGQKELEAELKRLAPPNGRAILTFRAPCGCPAARFEGWGAKRMKRSSKR